MRFCSFDAMQSSWPGEKSNAESSDIWSEACEIEKEYVQTELMYNVWSICAAFCHGHSEVWCWRSWFPDVSSGPDLCKVRSLHSGGRRWLSALLIEEVQMLIQFQYTKYFSFHVAGIVNPLLIHSSCSQSCDFSLRRTSSVCFPNWPHEWKHKGP